MASALVQKLFEKYRRFVETHVETVSRVESSTRFCSYLAPGLTATTSEFCSAAVSLVTQINDAILRNAADLHLNYKDVERNIAVVLTVIENVEVFLEMAASGGGPDSRRWLVVAIVQVVKAILHLVLLLKYKAGIVPSPPIPPLKRDKGLLASVQNKGPVQQVIDEPDNGASTFTLRSTGRIVRSMSAGQGLSNSSSQEVSACAQPLQRFYRPSVLDNQQIIAECLHIIRPIVHLISMYLLGQSSWKPWLIACGVDCASLCMIGDIKQFNTPEKEEIKRRAVVMLLYLLRSPFYDRYSKERLLFFLGILAHKVPIVRVIARPILEYLPVWQQIYFYVWAV